MGSHMAYTVDGTVGGDCPPGFPKRLPQIQLFVRINNYEGGQYTFSDNTLPTDEEVFHADFMNGWQEGKLEEIIAGCEPIPVDSPDDYNPPCTCDQFLTKKDKMLDDDHEFGRNDAEAAKICPINTREYILDEDVEFGVGGLPRGSCTGTLITDVDPPFVSECGLKYTPNTFDEESCEGGGSGDESGDESEDKSEDVGGKFIWKVKKNKTIRKNCKWVGKKKKKNAKFCNKKTSEGIRIRVHCPETCDMC